MIEIYALIIIAIFIATFYSCCRCYTLNRKLRREKSLMPTHASGIALQVKNIKILQKLHDAHVFWSSVFVTLLIVMCILISSCL